MKKNKKTIYGKNKDNTIKSHEINSEFKVKISFLNLIKIKN